MSEKTAQMALVVSVRLLFISAALTVGIMVPICGILLVIHLSHALGVF